jgi:hypothetical protein
MYISHYRRCSCRPLIRIGETTVNLLRSSSFFHVLSVSVILRTYVSLFFPCLFLYPFISPRPLRDTTPYPEHLPHHPFRRTRRPGLHPPRPHTGFHTMRYVKKYRPRPDQSHIGPPALSAAFLSRCWTPSPRLHLSLFFHAQW